MKKVVILFAMILASILLPNQSNSQITACGNTEPCSGQWFNIGPVFYEVSPGCWVQVELEVRNCFGQDEYRYNVLLPFLPTPNNCNYSDLSTEQLNKLIDLNAIRNIGSTIPACTEAPARVVKYEEVNCVFEKRCSTFVELTSDMECNFGTGKTAGTVVEYVETEHLPCGTSCCKIEYDVCSKSYTIGGVAQIDRIVTNFSRTELTPCTAPPTGNPADCIGCQ